MKKAFTMIELVFVIVIIGIIAAVIVPNTRTNPVAENAIELVSNIRYAQHLAMVDDKFGSNTNWMRERWQIAFSGTGNTQYSIVSNGIFAVDALNKDKNISNIVLEGMTLVTFSPECGGTSISFDAMGRPLIGDISADTSAYATTADNRLMAGICVITLTDGTETASVNIENETGYARIIY